MTRGILLQALFRGKYLLRVFFGPQLSRPNFYAHTFTQGAYMSDPTTSTQPIHPATPTGRPSPGAQRSATPATPVRRQYVSFVFYKLQPEFRRLPQDQQRQM